MGLIKELKKNGLNREGRLIISTLKVSEKRDVSDTNTGKRLQRAGFINTDGKISKKGKLALKSL